MSVYLRRNQPRRQTLLTGKMIKNVERYDRYYDIAYDALKNGSFPRITLPTGRLVVRAADGRYNARGIPPNSSTGTTNRFNGLRLDGRPGQGALYIGTIAGVLREYAHYSMAATGTKPAQIWKPAAADVTTAFMHGQRTGAAPVNSNTKFFLFQVNQALHFADLRVTSLAVFMAQLRASGGRRYGIVDHAEVDFLAMAASSPDDYSVPRGIADAVYDLRHLTGLAGVCAFSSRTDRDSGLVASSEGDPTGGLIFAVLGADSSELTTLTPIPKSPTQPGFDTFAELSAALKSK